MAMIFVRRLVAGTQSWDKIPLTWKAQVKEILLGWVEDNTISRERYTEITGEEAPETDNAA